MPSLSFTANLQRHVKTPEAPVAGNTVGEVLDSYFQQFPEVRPYVLDDQGAVRYHVAVFLNKTIIQDRIQLSDQVKADDDILVVQALSGG